MKPMKKKDYEEALEPLQLELNDLAHWLAHTGTRMMVLLEGRDTGRHTIEYLNPRQVRTPRWSGPPSARPPGASAARPARGRRDGCSDRAGAPAGVEKVFLHDEQHRPLPKRRAEKLVDDGILLYASVATIAATREERFAERVRTACAGSLDRPKSEHFRH